jgi:uncharacterized protein
MIGRIAARGERAGAALAAFALALVVAASLALAAFPALTGRVVDEANVIAPGVRSQIESKLADLEAKSGIQFAVATVRSLDGQEIEPYANALFRQWKLGEAKANNGVLLLVAPNERRVRIEVGYGLEGALTDALSKVIIVNAITPRFKQGDFGGGILRGVEDVITVLTTDSSEWQKRPELRAEDQPGLIETLLPFIVIGLFLFVFISVVRNATAQNSRVVRRGGRVVILPPSGGGWGGGGWSGGGGGWSGGGGGWSGGGGSSGGGGASGSW